MALQEDNDTTGDVISVDGAPADIPPTAEDRGDVVEPELSVDNLKALVKDAPAEAATKDEVKPQHIPKSRFDEVNNKKNELQQELADARLLIESMRAPKPAQAEQATPAVDLKALRAQSREALMDGDLEKVAELDDLIDAEVIRVAEDRFAQRQASQQTAQSLQSASVQAVADFPYLDTPEGEEALDLILASRNAKIARGMPPAEALRTAVASIAPKFAPETPLGFAPGSTATDTRTAAALARGATDSTLQPPSVKAGSGNRAAAGRVNVNDMTEEQFENLAPAEKKRMRGDM